MKTIYAVEVNFDYPEHLHWMRHMETYLVEAGTIHTAAKLGSRLARRDRNGGYAPRILRIEDRGTIDAR